MRELVAPKDGQTLTYQIEADGVLGETYTLVGAAWRSEAASRSMSLEANRYRDVPEQRRRS